MASAVTAHVLNTKTDEKCYLRLHLIVVKDGTFVLRARFNHSIPPSQLHTRLQQLIGTINYARYTNIISGKYYSLLYPLNTLPTSEDFDVTLLVFLLRNFCGLDRNSKWWNVHDNCYIPDTEMSEEADIVRIRNIEKAQHSKEVALFHQIKFGEKLDNVEKAMLRLASRSGMQRLPRENILTRKEVHNIVTDKTTHFSRPNNGKLNRYDKVDGEHLYFNHMHEENEYDDEFQDTYDVFSDEQDDNKFDDKFLDGYEFFTDEEDFNNFNDGWPDELEYFDENEDSYDKMERNKKMFYEKQHDHFDEVQEGYDNFSSRQSFHDYHYELQDAYDDFIGGQEVYDSIDSFQDDYIWEHFNDNDEMQDEYNSLFEDELEHDSYDELYDEYVIECSYWSDSSFDWSDSSFDYY